MYNNFVEIVNDLQQLQERQSKRIDMLINFEDALFRAVDSLARTHQDPVVIELVMGELLEASEKCRKGLKEIR